MEVSVSLPVLGGGLIRALFTWAPATGYDPSLAVFLNNTAAGLLIIATGVWSARSLSSAPDWIQVAVGAWLLVAPIFLDFHFNSGLFNMAAGPDVLARGQ